MLDARRRLRPNRLSVVPIALAAATVTVILAGCSGGSKSTDAPAVDSASITTGPPVDTSISSVSVSAGDTGVATSAPTSVVQAPPISVGPRIGCLTNGSISGAIDEKVVDGVTQVNTQNLGENAPDAYYATTVGKNTVGYFVFGKKTTVVVNGDGSWTGQSGADSGAIAIAADGTGGMVKATIEGSDVNGLRAKPLTLDLVTKCGVELPVVVAPTAPPDTKQKFTEKIVEETDLSKTPS